MLYILKTKGKLYRKEENSIDLFFSYFVKIYLMTNFYINHYHKTVVDNYDNKTELILPSNFWSLVHS